MDLTLKPYDEFERSTTQGWIFYQKNKSTILTTTAANSHNSNNNNNFNKRVKQQQTQTKAIESVYNTDTILHIIHVVFAYNKTQWMIKKTAW